MRRINLKIHCSRSIFNQTRLNSILSKTKPFVSDKKILLYIFPRRISIILDHLVWATLYTVQLQLLYAVIDIIVSNFSQYVFRKIKTGLQVYHKIIIITYFDKEKGSKRNFLQIHFHGNDCLTLVVRSKVIVFHVMTIQT